ncbi:MAG: hypothetical protein QOE61_33 [Micromonosporaceae bacterium]|nr:hypothetical protein [Micromonosporaceae bacterium]
MVGSCVPSGARADLGDRGHHLRPDPQPDDGVVPRLLDIRLAEGRRLGVEPAEGAGDQLVRDRLGDAAPTALGLRPSGPRPSQQEARGRRDLHWREEPGLRGGRQKGKKALLIVAVEQPQKGFGRARLIPVADAKAKTVRAFLADHVEPGSTVVTDGFASYAPCTVPNLASRVVSCAFVEVRPPCGTR